MNREVRTAKLENIVKMQADRMCPKQLEEELDIYTVKLENNPTKVADQMFQCQLKEEMRGEGKDARRRRRRPTLSTARQDTSSSTRGVQAACRGW